MNEACEVCDEALDFIRSESCLSPPGLRVGRSAPPLWKSAQARGEAPRYRKKLHMPACLTWLSLSSL